MANQISVLHTCMFGYENEKNMLYIHTTNFYVIYKNEIGRAIDYGFACFKNKIIVLF